MKKLQNENDLSGLSDLAVAPLNTRQFKNERRTATDSPLRQSIILLIIASACFGTMPLLTQLLSRNMLPQEITLWRYSISSLMLLVYIIISMMRGQTKISLHFKRDYVWNLFAGIFLGVYAIVFTMALGIYGPVVTLIWTYVALVASTSFVYPSIEWVYRKVFIKHDPCKKHKAGYTPPDMLESCVNKIAIPLAAVFIIFIAAGISRAGDNFSPTLLLEYAKSPAWLAVLSGALFGLRMYLANKTLEKCDAITGEKVYKNKEATPLLYEQVVAAGIAFVILSFSNNAPHPLLPTDVITEFPPLTTSILIICLFFFGTISTAAGNLYVYRGTLLLPEGAEADKYKGKVGTVKTITAIEMFIGMAIIFGFAGVAHVLSIPFRPPPNVAEVFWSLTSAVLFVVAMIVKTREWKRKKTVMPPPFPPLVIARTSITTTAAMNPALVESD
ncbi:MAG: DMT family transporter [Oscillospiraceae bacterium]|nr:DMT family transporter [Oscillospiraceae bacterium]